MKILAYLGVIALFFTWEGMGWPQRTFSIAMLLGLWASGKEAEAARLEEERRKALMNPGSGKSKVGCGLVTVGMIVGAVLGSHMGIAAFGGAISGLLPLAIIGGIAGAVLASKLSKL